MIRRITDNWKQSEIIEKIVRLARKEQLSYDDFIYVCQQARKKLGLHRPRKEKRLLQILPEAELKKFFQIISECGNSSTRLCSNCFSLPPSGSGSW